MKKLTILISILAFTLLSAYAESESLKGLKTVKFVVDLNQGKPALINLRINLIKQTIEDIRLEGVEPTVVVAIRGGASKMMTKHDNHVDYEHRQIKQQIQNKIKELFKMGVQLEQCNVALSILGISPNDIIPEITVVKNGYVSLIGYQNKGYALLPME